VLVGLLFHRTDNGNQRMSASEGNNSRYDAIYLQLDTCVSKMQTHRTGGCTPLRLLCRDLHFQKAFVELTSNSNRHVTLRLTVFEILAVKWPNLGPKFGFGIPGVPPPKWETICPGPRCTIVQNFTPIGATVAEISTTGRTEKKHSNELYPSILTYGGRVKICNSCTAGMPAPEFEHFGRYLQYIGLFWRQTRRRDALQNSTRPPRRVTTRRSMLTTAYRS